MQNKDYSNRIGEESIATNGMKIKISEYFSSSNVTVVFEDGTTVYNKNYVDFKRGKVGYPKQSKIGNIAISNSGMKMEVVAYRKYNDIDIVFEDGTLLEHVGYGSFIKGEVAYPAKKRIGETSIARNGMKLTIVEYRDAGDIDVQFEDGTLVKNRKYYEFTSRKIGYPRPCRVGEKVIANNGMEMKIIAYHGSRNVDVQFEDGTIVKGREYKCFQQGAIANPQYNRVHIGEENIAGNGMRMKIISFRNAQDIDIEFEDGAVVKNRTYYSFCIGNIGYPKEDRTNEENIGKNGMRMKILAYRNSSDIDVQFEDGTIVKHKSYLHFKEGYIGYPRPDHIGEEMIANNGLKMKIIKYHNSSNVDIEFEDGVVVTGRCYQNFKSGSIIYPQDRLYDEGIANNGLKMRIIKYRSATDIDIEFEDGVVVEHKGYKEFKRGQIGHPYISVHRSLPEKIICYFIGRKIDYLANYKPDWLMDNKNVEENKKAEFDIYIPSKRVAIEYDGVRYHQNVEKDNYKSRSACVNNSYIDSLIRIREEGAPPLDKLSKLFVIEVKPFSVYHKDTLRSLESVIKHILHMLELVEDDVVITNEIVDYCRSEEFYRNEQIIFKRLGCS